MKSIIILVSSVLIVSVCFAQKISADMVPVPVKSGFINKYPSITKIVWEKEKGNYEANFKMNKKEFEATFDSTGNWIKTAMEIEVSDLPLFIVTAVNNEFADAKIKEAAKGEFAGNKTYFEVNIKVGRLHYQIELTPDGKIFSKEQLKDY